MFPLYNTFGLLNIAIALFIFSTVLKKSDGGVSLMVMVDALLLSRLSIKKTQNHLCEDSLLLSVGHYQNHSRLQLQFCMAIEVLVRQVPLLSDDHQNVLLSLALIGFTHLRPAVSLSSIDLT